MTNQISMIELFSGIGAQERALRQLNLPYEVKHTCDCDANATLSYAAMRWDLEKEMETFDFPSQAQMIEELQVKNLGYDFQKGKHSITSRTPITKLKQYYIADKLSKNLGDISRVERLPYTDFWTYSYPCTDLSVAGKGEGMVNKCDKCNHSWSINFEDPKTNNMCPNCGNIDIKSTRSGLLGQVQRLLTVSYEEGTLPKYLLLENVKNLVGSKFKPQFDAWVNWLDLIGYNTYYKVLNAKHYGIPQNRERIFAISIRKDVDTNGFTFPEQIALTTRLKDMLEQNVDEKYYLPDDRIEKILNSTFVQEKKRIQMTDVCDTLLARDWKDPKCVPVEEEPEVKQLMNIMPTKTRDNPNQGRVYDTNGIAPTLTKMDGGNREPMVIDEIKVIGNYMPSNHDASRVVDIEGIAPTVKENHGTVTAIAEPHILEPNTCLIQPKDRDYKKKNQPREVHIESKDDGVSHALRTNGETMVMEPQLDPVAIVEDQFPGSRDARIYEKYSPTLRQNCSGLKVAKGALEDIIAKIRWRIRKLTSKECWRLMNFTDKDCDRTAQYVSPSAQYKQAGNSIVVACLIALMSSLFIEDGHKAEVWTKYTLNFND
jgi:DNA (cytosine-5)-methyltransferase 1